MDHGCMQGRLARWSLAIVPVGVTLISLGCPGTTTPPPPDEQDIIFPENFRESFTVVRDCRNSIEHEATVRVWINAIGEAGYLDDAATLPEGTIVIKEEFAAGADCDDADLAFWSVMRKEPAGFDPAANDWRFQEVAAPNRRISLDGKSTCIDCHTVTECVVRDLMCTLP